MQGFIRNFLARGVLQFMGVYILAKGAEVKNPGARSLTGVYLC